MPESMRQEVDSLKRQWLIICSLSLEILEQSNHSERFNDRSYLIDFRQNQLDDCKGQRKQVLMLKSYIKDELEYWENWIDIWTELFWQKATELGLQYPRKEPIKMVLVRGRFSGGGEASHTYYEWTRLLESGILQQRYSSDELNTIERIMAEDQIKRLNLLKKCLKLKRVASSDYLRYGDAIGYFTRGKLFDGLDGSTLLERTFNKEDIETLNAIWK